MQNLQWSDIFYYDESSPSFLRWKVKTGKVRVGDQAGCLSNGCDYYRVRYNTKLYRCHRIIWEIFNGNIQDKFQVDRINGNSVDNSIGNLRLVTNQQNGQNMKKHRSNTSGVVGVVFDKNRNRWAAKWHSLSSKSCVKYFSVTKYGYEEAFKMACEYRISVIEEINLNGGCYTERHGT